MKLLPQPPQPKKPLATLRAKMPSKGRIVGGIIFSKPTEAEKRESAELVAQIRALQEAGDESRRKAMKILQESGYRGKPNPPYRGGFRMS